MIRKLIGFVAPAALMLVFVPAADAADTPPTYKTKPSSIVQSVTGPTGALTLRLSKTPIRAAGFSLLIQRPDGSLFNANPVAERTYVGTVDGHPGAIASAIIRSTDLTLQGTITFDRGASWSFSGTSVTDARPLPRNPTYHHPSSTTAANNVPVGAFTSTTYRWDLGIDVTAPWYAAHASDRKAVLDEVELGVANLFTLYGSEANLRPALKRVVIRTTQSVSPYPNGTPALGEIRGEWYGTGRQADAAVDDAFAYYGTSGGVAYVAAATTSYGEGRGARWTTLRHELGHTWGAHDNQSNSPEGATVMSGNTYNRFDASELGAIIRYRNSVLAKLDVDTRALPAFPPYATADFVTSGGLLHVLANDHDANGDAITLAGVEGATHLGGTAVRSGNDVIYTPALGATGDDWFTYAVRDATGRTATGLVVVHLG